MLAACKAGKSMLLAIGNDMADQIEEAGTVLWFGTGSALTYARERVHLPPGTISEGQGCTQAEIIACTEVNAWTSAACRVSNNGIDRITDVGIHAHISLGTQQFNNMVEPPQ